MNKILLGICFASFAVLVGACSDSTGDSCNGVCADPAYHCDPVFNVKRLSGRAYSECEENIVRYIDDLQECNDICLGETIYNEKEIHLSYFDFNHWYCNLSAKGKKNETCSIKYVGSTFDALQRTVGYCDMDHIVSDGAIKHFVCESGDTVSVNEGLRRKEALEGSSVR
ncbi:hypothetical protein SAMN05720766_1361 [Fibrobacter sp. UWH9]|uniref:hypothetical protein n=1 Tax=Fibrobacter sp. UWH9 TaxID=1896213 RepID=UPI00090F0FAF|nr:hypothetical protein [Fibrobacter sp. UWH9]SHH90168.1 hypothetical protein SAMN05720766_1361 [Fibrobacter sp. UWH9]